MANVLTGMLVVLATAGCGGAESTTVSKPSEPSHTSDGSASPETPTGDGTIPSNEVNPVLLKLFYYDNGKENRITVPVGQSAEYEVKYCSVSNESTCFATFYISCSSESSCTVTNAPSDPVSVTKAGAEKTIVHSRPVLQHSSGSYRIKARAYTASKASTWKTGVSCTYSIPAQCWSD